MNIIDLKCGLWGVLCVGCIIVNEIIIRNNGKFICSIAGTCYVGLSNAVLLAQYNKVYAVDIVPEKLELINDKNFSDSW